MSLLENLGLADGYFYNKFQSLTEIFINAWNHRHSDSSDSSTGPSQINGNIIGNNAAILLTDDAQNTVNFLYVNPIQFFNNGRAGDIYINITTEGDSAQEATGQLSGFVENDGNEHTGSSSSAEDFVGDATATDHLEPANFLETFTFPDDFNVEDAISILDSLAFQNPLSLLDALGFPVAFDPDNVADDIVDSIAENVGDGSEINDNVIGNNAAILLTDDAQNTVNFLYINPIEFFNNGRASDIYITFNGGSSQPDNPVDFDQSETAARTLEPASDFPDTFAFPDDFNVADAVSILDSLGLQNPPSILDALGYPDTFDFDNVSDDIVHSITEELGDGSEFNDNVIGNNAAILLTDNAQNTVNFLYVNPIEFFNDGRAGDIYLTISLDGDDGLAIL